MTAEAVGHNKWIVIVIGLPFYLQNIDGKEVCNGRFKIFPAVYDIIEL